MNNTVLRATKAMDRESTQTRKERVAVVEGWQNEWGDQCYCSLGRKTLRDTSESAKLVVTGIGGLINAGFHGQYVCCRGECRGCWRSDSGTVLSSSWRLLTVREGLCYRQAEGCWRSEWDCAIVKLKAVDGQSGTVLSSSWQELTEAEVSFCLVPTSIACLFTIQSTFGLSHPQQQIKQKRAERKPQNKKRWKINIEHKTQYSGISWTWRGFFIFLFFCSFGLSVFVEICCFVVVVVCLFVVVVDVVCVVVCFFAVFVFLLLVWLFVGGGGGEGVNWSSMFFSGYVI